MRCYCCGVILTTQEATRRFKGSGVFVDMCTTCLRTIDDQVEYTEGRAPKNREDELQDEWDEL